MALNASKTILLEKQYLYVKASKGFQLEGTNIEKIWVNTGYYRFLVDNVAKALSNSYVNILYDPTDIDFIAYCSDLFMEEIQNSVVTAVENLETYLQQFAQQNHDDFGLVQDTLDDLNTGLSGALQSIVANMTKTPVVFNVAGLGSSYACDITSFTSSFTFRLRMTGSWNGYIGNGSNKLTLKNITGREIDVVLPDGQVVHSSSQYVSLNYELGVYEVIING